MTTNITINILLLTVTNWIGIDGPNEVGFVKTNTVLEAVCEGQTNQFTLKTEDSFRYVLRPAALPQGTLTCTNVIDIILPEPKPYTTPLPYGWTPGAITTNIDQGMIHAIIIDGTPGLPWHDGTLYITNKP